MTVSDGALACQRDRFSLPPGTHYLNAAYMSPLSHEVQQAGMAGIRREAVPASIRVSDFFDGCDAVRRLFAGLVGLEDPTRVAIIPAASYGLATAARNTTLAAGQNVVTVRGQFPSNVHAWRRLCHEAGATLRVVDPPTAGPERERHWNEAILGAVDGDTGLVALGSVHWTDGSRFDLERIGARAREVGASFVVDGTQSVGVEPFDVRRVRPDALICAGYKWLTGPYSIGVAYYGSRFDGGTPIEETWAARVGSDDFAGLVTPSEEYRPGAVRYDVGEAASFILVPMLVAALEQVEEWGVRRIHAYVEQLTRSVLRDERWASLGLEAPAPAAPHLFGLRLPDTLDPRRAQARLAELGVQVSVRGDLVRVSPHVYNDAEDMEALLTGLTGGPIRGGSGP